MFLLFIAPLAEVSLPALIARYHVLGNRGRLPARQEVALMGAFFVSFLCFLFLFGNLLNSILILYILFGDIGRTRYGI